PVWLIEPLPASPDNLARLEAVGNAIRVLTGGDAVENVDRLLRLPGTINYPKAPKRAAGRIPIMARLLGPPDPIPRYTLEQLEAAFPPGPVGATAASGQGAASTP